MLTSTFSHLKGLSLESEATLWERGVLNWNDLVRTDSGCLSEWKREAVLAQVESSREALAQENWGFFLERLPSAARGRLWPHIRKRFGYVDIETTGLGPGSRITTVAIYDGRQVACFVRGINLDDARAALQRCDVLVTYNGATFDLPFLRAQLDIELAQPHIDLRYVLRGLGYTGGLKQCERMLGVRRGVAEGIDGAEAVRLWFRYKHYSDHEALRTLMLYNMQDTISLESILVKACELSLRRHPLAPRFSIPAPPNPHESLFDN